jgi:hypothetical protein
MGGTGTTGGATSASSASFQRVAYRHQRLPAGEADLRHHAEIVPAGFAEGKELFRDFDADHVGSGVLGAGLAAAGAVDPVIGRMEHESSFSPSTFRSSGMISPIVHYIVPVIGVLAAGKRLR